MKVHDVYNVIGTLVLVCAITAIGAPAQTLTTLVTFDGTNGSAPAASLIQASDGNLYGTTEYGGPINDCEGGFNPCGTVFKVTTSGTLTTLHTFIYSDGAFPVSPVVQGSDGNLYGTNQGEGDSGGAGAIFKMTLSGTLTVLDSVSSPAGLVQGRDGNFYGTTPRSYTDGTVFKITPSGTLTTLHTFDGTDGDNPQAGLVLGTDGNFYGTTYSGGTSNNCGGGCGTVFKITPSGSLTTLHSFSGTDGYNVQAGLVQGSDGNFYGTTFNGGAQNIGEVYKITPSGTLTVLHSFNGTDGAYPRAALIQASDGNFYGTAFQGGTNSQGTVFAITSSGSLTALYSFCAQTGCADGANPVGGVVQASDGYLYGTTNGGGADSAGTVFKFQLVSYTLTVTAPQNGTVTSSDGFINCPGSCTHSYVENSQVTLTGNPAQGYQFGSWGGACSGSNPSCTVAISNNETVSATFTQSSYALTVTISGQGTVTSTDGYINCPGTCSHSYLSFTAVTLNAAAASGWNFQGWSGACSGVGPCALTMLSNYGVSAYFNQPGSGLHFSAITPCRLVDTRTQNGGGDPIPGGSYQTFNLPQLSQSKGCADLSSAASYSLNVTLVPQNQHPVSYLTIWPAGLAQPLISTMNSLDGRIKANAAVVPAGVSSAVSIYVTNTTDVVIDIDGFFAAAGQSTLLFYPLTPCRVADTRKSTFPPGLGTPHLSAGVQRDFPVLNSACIPSDVTPAAYSFNFTAIPYPALGDQLGYLEVWPKDQQPAHPVSTLNNPTGTYVANGAIVPAGTSGEITVYPASDTDVAIDINGYFAASGSGGLSLYPTAPCRVIDTRKTGNGQPFTGTLTPPVNVVDSVCATPSSAQAYVFNATVVPSGYLGYLTLWPDSEGQPIVSTLNAADGWITSNMAIVPSINGKVDAYADGLTQLILDISSYFAP